MFKLKTKSSHFLYTMLVAVLFVGCARDKTQPIEKYGGSKYVVSKIEGTDWGRLYNVQLKNTWIQDLNATRSVTNVLFKFSF